jgi:AAA+ superfamily predicted ATPase
VLPWSGAAYLPDNVLLFLIRDESDRRTGLELDPKLVESLRKAIDAMPDNVELRLHLATLLIEAGQRDEGIRELGVILQADPANVRALALITGTQPADSPGAQPGPGAHGAHPDRAAGGELPSQGESRVTAEPGSRAGAESRTQPALGEPVSGAELASEADPASEAEPASEANPVSGAEPASDAERGSRVEPGPTASAEPDFDWGAAESQLADVLPPRFVSSDGAAERAAGTAGEESGDQSSRAFDVEHAGLRLSDVAGMADVKQRLEAAFLAPMRNPDLRKLYGKSLRGGLLMYGPPGCGKTFIARAVAGELGARFLAVSFADVVDSMLGQSERNIQEIFGTARQNAPCVVFLDEVDAIGQKRTQLRHTPMRAVVNQLLLELDDVTAANEGVFLLAATNHPWDVDSALRRPGRFDRMLLVLPPDQHARAAIFRYHLRDRPVERVDPERLAKLTDGYSGADIAHVCESAAELALLDSVRRGEPRMIGQPDLEAAIGEVRPSLSPWFDAARNVALFANEGGAYDDLAAYLKKKRLL